MDTKTSARCFITEEVLNTIASLSSASKTLYLYIILYLDSCDNVIDLSYNKKYMGVAYATYKNSLIELEEKEILIKLAKYVYKVNIKYVQKTTILIK